MKTEITKLPKSEIELKIEVPVQEWQEFLDGAAKELAKDLKIEGFRPGYVPLKLVEEKIGKGRILETATENCVRKYYLKAILENNIEAIGQPEISILPPTTFPEKEVGQTDWPKSGGGLIFKAKVAVMPEIKLPDYKKIVSQIKKKKVEVTSDEIARLKAEKERLEKEKLREEILGKIAQNLEMEIPQVLLEVETKRMLENFKQQVVQFLQISFEDYLKKVNKTEEELLNSLAVEAKKRVRNSLILKKIEKEENIESTEEEIKAESEKILSKYPNASHLDRERLKEYTKEAIKNEKTFQLLESFAIWN